MEMCGVYTALVTPFTKEGKVDYGKLGELLEIQIAGGVDGVVPVGTTGESPTLDAEEHMKVIEETVKRAAGRCKVMAGTGANCAEEAVALTKHAAEVGADCTLQVTPYYNKPTQEGLYRHFSMVADTCKLPVVLYNVPGRTGTPIAAETIARLAKNTNIIAVKEAGGSVERVSEILSLCDIAVMCGDDSLTVPMMSVGAKGVISVASNIIPAELKKMTDACAAGDFASALLLHRKYYKLFKTLFIESNPIPVKAAMAILGQIEEVYRLPLCEMAQGNRDKLESVMRECLSDSFKF
ncbi:MAG: 4-hydroxy-tetrahydrodipicolinate synthase [Lentisphaeria bacterium]|nr:4-hydroxy-tetrahydrodipicolinate synthase [Lentisphaeria bacterium]